MQILFKSVLKWHIITDSPLQRPIVDAVSKWSFLCESQDSKMHSVEKSRVWIYIVE
jgi:hypothetical protein